VTIRRFCFVTTSRRASSNKGEQGYVSRVEVVGLASKGYFSLLEIATLYSLTTFVRIEGFVLTFRKRAIMSPTVKISSANEFNTLLKTSNVVITDCKHPSPPHRLILT
jgi:hypothetical protein